MNIVHFSNMDCFQKSHGVDSLKGFIVIVFWFNGLPLLLASWMEIDPDLFDDHV